VAPAATNLLAHYAFEGDASDSTGIYPATVTGAPTYVEGKVGQAIKLDGARDLLTAAGNFDLPAYTVAMWFRVDGGTAERDLFSSYNDAGGHGILLEMRANGALRFLHRSPMGTGGGSEIYSNNFGAGRLDDGAWYHAAIVKSADTMYLYVNGELVGTKADATRFDQVLPRITLGVLKHDGTSRLFPGAIDDVYVYDRVLSQEEIASLAGRTAAFSRP